MKKRTYLNELPRHHRCGLHNRVKRKQRQNRPSADVWEAVDIAIREVAPRLLASAAPSLAETLSMLPDMNSEAAVYDARHIINEVRTSLANMDLIGDAFELVYAAQKAYSKPAEFMALYRRLTDETVA